MSLKHIDIESALRRRAERLIEDAIKEGKFDNLPGAGKPLVLDPIPADDNARQMWWAIRILRGNHFIPDEVVLRKQIDVLKAELADTRCAARVRTLVIRINLLVYRLNTMGTNAIPSGIAPVDLDAELRRLGVAN